MGSNCYGLNVCIPFCLQTHTLQANPPCDLPKSSGHEVGALMMRLVPLEEIGESLLNLSACWATGR